MAFEQQQSVTVTGFEDVEITLFIPGENNTSDPQSGEIVIQLTQSNGVIKVITADLLARLNDDAAGQAHLANLASLRDYILARIPLEVLP